MRTATIALLSADPTGLTTFDAFDPESFSLTSLINDALVFIDTEGEVRPALATGWRRPSPLELELDLRTGVRFHNGEPFDADAVVATFAAHRGPTPSASQRGILSPIVAAERVASHVVRLRTAFPDAMLLRRLFLSSIYPAGVLAREGREALYRHPIGTGAYRFVRHDLGREIVLERNPEHWLGQATIDRLRFPFFRRIEWVDRLGRGEVDVALAIDAHDRIRAARAGLTVDSRASANTQWFQLASRGVLTDVRVRRALNHAINRKLLVELTAQGFGRSQLGVASEAEQGHTELLPYRYDPVLARAMLQEAGVAEGTVLRGLVSEASTALYFAVREMLLRVGIVLEATIVTRSEWMARVVKGNIAGRPYDGDFALIALDNPILHALFHHFILLSSKGPFSLLRDPAYDARFERAVTAFEDAPEAQAELERFARDEALLLFTQHEDVHVAYRPGFGGVIPCSGHFDTDALTKLWAQPSATEGALGVVPPAAPDLRRLLEATSHADGFFLPPDTSFEQASAAQLWESLRATEERWRVQVAPALTLSVSLEDARSNLRNILESTERSAIAGFSVEGRRLFANRGFAQLFGDASIFEWLGAGWSAIRAEVDATGSWQGPVAKPQGDGRLMLTVTRARDGQDVVAGYVLVFTDFSGEEERIRTQSVRSIVENVPYGLLACDRAGRVRDGYSEACTRIFPDANVGLVGRRFTELLGLGARDAGHFEAMYEQIVDDVMPVNVSLGNLPAELAIAGRTYSLSASVMRDRAGAVDGVLLTLVEITELITARAEVEELRGIVEVLRYREAFAGFARAFATRLADLILRGWSPEVEATARRELHMAKGVFALFRLGTLARAIHALEDRPQIDTDALRGIDARLRQIVRANVELWRIDLDDAPSARGAAFGVLAGPLARLCEEEALALGKRVELVVDGREVPLPERLAPVMQLLPQLVRNSIAHGIERADDRAKKGPVATIALAARTLGEGGLEIELRDDGHGIDVERVVDRAVALGATTRGRAGAMNDAERLGLVFVAGLSTAAATTAIAGRGIGLAAVKTAVEALAGTIRVESQPGIGTAFVMRFAS